MMEAASTSETWVNVYQTTQCNNPEDSNLQTHSHENLKFHKRKNDFVVYSSLQQFGTFVVDYSFQTEY
jgi:hypothetical protein